MNSLDVVSLFEKIHVRNVGGKPIFYKPILILYALEQCFLGNERLMRFEIIESRLTEIFNDCFHNEMHKNFHHAFGRLENEGIWEITNSFDLKRTSSGDLSKSELIEKNISGGFVEEIYQALSNNPSLLLMIVNQLLNRYFPVTQHQAIRSVVGLPDEFTNTLHEFIAEENNNNYFTGKPQESGMEIQKNDYIAYLNSLHNISANGANALAESQALNPHFGELYQPFPLIESLYQALTNIQPRVVLLTGHAGDGKSTIALDIFKRLHNLPVDQPLATALNEREDIAILNGTRVSIVKDMSELTKKKRLDWLYQAFNESGNWLIVSNTGPLINSLEDFATQQDPQAIHIESDILKLLDQPYEGGDDLTRHTLNTFSKPLVILNMTRLDNVELGAKILSRMINHSGWEQCRGCVAEACCALRANRLALQKSHCTEDRVRWIYQRLTAYEQRLTLRQMVAHLAFSLTGAMSCQEAKAYTGTSAVAGLEKVLFSEGFFGYRSGEPWHAAESLRAVVLLRHLVFGGPTSVDFERQLLLTGELAGMSLPEPLAAIQQRWGQYANESTSVRWRFALRRMFYIFGQETKSSKQFLDTFLQSSKLQDFDHWQKSATLLLNTTEQRALKRMCLQVLLEIYSGFSSGQFQEKQDCLYLTLRRSDRTIIQPTQLVIAKLNYQDFSLAYDATHRCPVLVYKDTATLFLTLPLLDYIQDRSTGSLGNKLAPIHLAQLEWFRAQLLKVSKQKNGEEITLLRAGIDGEIETHNYILDQQKQQLEQD